MSRSDPSSEPASVPISLRPGTRIACARSSYHAEITRAMRDAALDWLMAHGLARNDFLEVEVPGAFELPLVARRLARRKDIDAVLAFGLVLRGETDHDRHIAHAVAQGLQRAAFETDTPVLFGVLTCATLEQARVRSRPASEGGLDKGGEVARAAAQMLRALDETLIPAPPRVPAPGGCLR